ncbi:MAG TPA: tRNA (pseudouridine(54)-N(1))-methyltransferase TrmY [Candidatus Acetothermia bacterium]|nr:tRNA (pseudouridine(54)-N(1))-methyltransferase TrmY [Candidatus Acetothermia bacterium]
MNEITRAFVVLSHTGPLTPDFPLADLPGSAGRLDILCRCATEAFLLSHGIRRDVRLYFVIRGELIVRLEGGTLRYLNPDERSTAALIRKAIAAVQGAPRGKWIPSTPGIHARWGDLSAVRAELESDGYSLYLLVEGGEFVRTVHFPERVGFFLSDHRDFAPDDLSHLKDLPRISLGPLSLQAQTCIALVHNELDLREAGWIKVS